MKKLTSVLILVALIVTSLVAVTSCGDKKPTDGIVGKWEAEIDLTKAMEASGESENNPFAGMDLSGLSMPIIFDFKEDGTYLMTTDKEKAKDVFSVLIDKLLESIEAQGVDADQAMQMLGGSSKDDLIEMIDKSMEESMKTEGKYTYEDGKLTLETDGEKNEFKVELDGSELTFVEVISRSADDDEGVFNEKMLPITFKYVG